MDNRLMDKCGGGEGEGEMNAEQYGTAYIDICKQRAKGNLLYDSGNSNWGSVITQRGGNGWEMGKRFKREGKYVHLWLIHVDI